MSWKLSKYRAGDLIEVRSKQEILATLDERGRLDGMPFMAEMFAFCGKRFRVSAVAHKTCDTARKTWTGRRLERTVHLAGLRCDGQSHGACEAQCNIFWKDEWLKRAGDGTRKSATASSVSTERPKTCTEVEVESQGWQLSSTPGQEPRYSCQATELFEATHPLSWWDPRQYVFDILTGNHPPTRVLRVMLLASLRWFLPRIPLGYRVFKAFHDRMHLLLTGRSSPSIQGQVPEGTRSPTGRSGLQPGEVVRIKTQAEIEKTLDHTGRNRGLTFDPEEMAPYCGRVARVRKSVTRIIEERSGKMLHMKEPCIVLEDVVCKAEYAKCRLNCPREIFSYWREIWLEKLKGQPEMNSR